MNATVTSKKWFDPHQINLIFYQNKKGFPKHLVIVFQSQIINKIRTDSRFKKNRDFGIWEYFDQNTEAQFGVAMVYGIGAPAAVFKVEQYIALGAEQIILLGVAGAIDKNLSIGDLLLPTQAVCGEGTSKYYQGTEKTTLPNDNLSSLLVKSAQRLGFFITSCTTWTTDAPFRETPEVLKHQLQNGVSCVEMEISALIHLCRFRKVDFGAAVCVSDLFLNLKGPGEPEWVPGFNHPKVLKGLQSLLDIAIDCFSCKNTP